jgi:hypothetical protein
LVLQPTIDLVPLPAIIIEYMRIKSGVVVLMLAVLLPAARSWPVGVQNIAGYTTNDQQVFGPALLRICNDSLSGIHVVWKDANSNPLYNYLPLGTEAWRWSNGTPVFGMHVSLGNMDWNPVDRVPYISGFFFDGHLWRATCAFDASAGSGSFRWFTLDWDQDVKWNLGSISYDGGRQFIELRGDSLGSHRTFGGNCLGRAGFFPSHNLAASKTNGNLAVFWTRTWGYSDSRFRPTPHSLLPTPYSSGDLYLRQSTNNGNYWRDTIVPSRSIPDSWRNTYLGAYGVYDHTGALHLVANTYDGTNRNASAIWHYCALNSPAWSLVHRFATSSSAGVITDEALICGRPSIGERVATGELFTIWEEFDTTNAEPETGIWRADIWSARSTDRGLTWGPAFRLTEPDNTSKRYPCIAPLVDSSLHVMYLIDSISGFSADGQGRATNNPVACLSVPASLIPSAIAEQPPTAYRLPPTAYLSVSPLVTKAGRPIHISATLPSELSARLVISDALGRIIMQRKCRGSFCTTWSQREPTGGVYFIRVETSDQVLNRKVVLTR